jgi:hypothetical protein
LLTKGSNAFEAKNSGTGPPVSFSSLFLILIIFFSGPFYKKQQENPNSLVWG